MEASATAPAMSSGRLLKSEPRKGRSISEDRIKFIEEEYDYLSVEIAAWLSQLLGKEIDSNLAESLKSGVALCEVVKHCLPSVEIGKYHESEDKNSFYARDNLTIFAKCCQSMGIDANDCVSVSMFDRGDKKQIVNALLHFALAGIKFGLKPISIKDKERVQTFVESMPEDVVKGLREMVEEAAEGTKGNEATEGNEATAKEQVVEKEWDISDDRNVIILIAFMFLVLIGMFYIASVLEKGLKWVVCSKHRSSENIESTFVG